MKITWFDYLIILLHGISKIAVFITMFLGGYMVLVLTIPGGHKSLALIFGESNMLSIAWGFLIGIPASWVVYIVTSIIISIFDIRTRFLTWLDIDY